MLKHELRKKYTALRTAIKNSKISEDSLLLANHALRLPIWNFNYFHIFLSITENKEVDTLPLITLLQGKDKQIVIPKITKKNTMESYLLTDGTVFKKNAWKIPEPVDGIVLPPTKIEVVFLPLLAFDLKGNRVGYGKGHYDAFLQNCRKETLKIGLSLFEAEDDLILDTYEKDVKLNYCITPHKIYTF